MSNSQDSGESSNNTIGSTQKSNSEDELLTPFFSSPTMKKMLEVMVIQTFDRVLQPILVKLIRNVVKEELELAKKNILFTKGNSGKDFQAPKPRSLKLKFLTKVSDDPVLTGEEIKGDGGNSIEVALVDDITGEIVDSGPEASAKVEIVILKGEFGDDNEGNWTAEEFCSNVVREKEGKKSLLAETVYVRLNKGVGSIDKIRFTHSSIYMKKEMFRLGAQVVDTFNSSQVKEARSESFTVKDGRQKYNEKHDPPSLSDGVQRLENIGRVSKDRLRDENVDTVEDFLILLLKDREGLKRILNLKPKKLKETISHARRCIINERIYTSIEFQEKEGVVFNIVGEVQGLIRELQYLPMHLLSESDKANAQRLLVSACENWDHVVPFDNETSFLQYLSQILQTKNSSNSPSLEVPSTSNGVENFRVSDEHCSTSSQLNVSSVIPARGTSAISLNDNLEFSNIPMYSPPHCWIDQWFEDNAHQPHDASSSKVIVYDQWKWLLNIIIFKESLRRRRAAALVDIQPLKKQKVF